MPSPTGNRLPSKKVVEEPPNYDEAIASANSMAGEMGVQTSMRGNDTRFAMISFAWTDRIRLIRFPEPIISLITEVLQKLWHKGIQKAQPFEGSFEIKLRGNPFHHGADDEKLAVRVSLMGILNALAKEGWYIVPAGGRVTRLGNYAPFGQKDSWIFSSQAPKEQAPKELSWICVSFNNADLLHLINAPSEIATAIISTFGDRIEKCNKDYISQSFEVKFKQSPWGQPTPKGMIQSRLLALDLIQCLTEQGYTMGTSVDLDSGIGGISYKSTGEVWFWYH